MSLKVESPAAVVTQSERSTILSVTSHMHPEQDPRRLGSIQIGVFASLFAVPTNRPYFGLVWFCLKFLMQRMLDEIEPCEQVKED